jgi:hypothetical protein
MPTRCLAGAIGVRAPRLRAASGSAPIPHRCRNHNMRPWAQHLRVCTRCVCVCVLCVRARARAHGRTRHARVQMRPRTMSSRHPEPSCTAPCSTAHRAHCGAEHRLAPARRSLHPSASPSARPTAHSLPHTHRQLHCAAARTSARTRKLPTHSRVQRYARTRTRISPRRRVASMRAHATRHRRVRQCGNMHTSASALLCVCARVACTLLCALTSCVLRARACARAYVVQGASSVLAAPWCCEGNTGRAQRAPE